ncbi:MAG TPA: UDP-2,3-diacylglucosamine diphosphatase [Steroidobacteraceae bacterium]|nr:UDP-2,3-diacylglucosamine diphosphatase [Steroidobacteraceae bacterium]
MSFDDRIAPVRLRTAFVSDVHLGTKGCRADLLLDFLRSVHVDTLFLVGDIVDVWSLRKTLYWPQAHNNVIRAVLGMARHGTRVIYVPGNHDEVFRELAGSVFGNLQIQRESVHRTADGRTLLVLHGDEFDGVVQCSPWLAKLGASVYELTLRMNRYVNLVRRLFGFPYWSLASYLKHKVKNAVQYIGNFEQAVAYAARKRGVDGVVCGHIHRAEMTELDGLLYCNDGDWVESCTALVEDMNGRLALWNWVEQRERLAAPGRAPQPAVEQAA